MELYSAGQQGTDISNIIPVIKDFVKGSSTAMVINKVVGSRVFTNVRDALTSICTSSRYQVVITILDLYHENANHYEDVLIEKASNGGVVMVDGAEHLERFERLADALRANESVFTKVIYLTTGGPRLKDAIEAMKRAN